MQRIEPTKYIYQQITSDPSAELDLSQFGLNGGMFNSEWAQIDTEQFLGFYVYPWSPDIEAMLDAAYESEDEDAITAAVELSQDRFLEGRAGEVHVATSVFRTEISYSRADMASRLVLDDALEAISNSFPNQWTEHEVFPQQEESGTTELFTHKDGLLLIGTVLRNGQSLGFIRVVPEIPFENAKGKLQETQLDSPELRHLTKTVFVGEDIDEYVLEFKKRFHATRNPFADLALTEVDRSEIVKTLPSELREREDAQPKAKPVDDAESAVDANVTLDPTTAHFLSLSQETRNAHQQSHSADLSNSLSQGYRQRR